MPIISSLAKQKLQMRITFYVRWPNYTVRRPIDGIHVHMYWCAGGWRVSLNGSHATCWRWGIGPLRSIGKWWMSMITFSCVFRSRCRRPSRRTMASWVCGLHACWKGTTSMFAHNLMTIPYYILFPSTSMVGLFDWCRLNWCTYFDILYAYLPCVAVFFFFSSNARRDWFFGWTFVGTEKKLTSFTNDVSVGEFGANWFCFFFAPSHLVDMAGPLFRKW